MMKLKETNWHRLLTMYKPTGFCMISACRGEYSDKENKARTFKLKKELENKGFWPILVSGGWIENAGTDEERPVGEATWFVPFFFGNRKFSASEYDQFSKSTFYKWCLELGSKYEQEAILYCPPNGKPRYVQTTVKDYGDGPVKKGTHTLKFDKEKIGDNKAEYFTDLSNPDKQGGYNSETGKFKKAPRRVTFESVIDLNDSLKKVYEASIDHTIGFGNTKFYEKPIGQHSDCHLSYTRPEGTTYLKILTYIAEHPGCKKIEFLKTIGDPNRDVLWRSNKAALLNTLHADGFFRITTKGEYFPTKKCIDFVKEHSERTEADYEVF